MNTPTCPPPADPLACDRAQRVLPRLMLLCLPVAFLAASVSVSVGQISPPYPPSTAIPGLQWHETLNMGTDNDNWPTTWADDDHVYTAGGDGDGFGGERGNWVCRILGDTTDLSGENRSQISTPTGAEGAKGSGILSVGGTLYLWARNADGDGNHGQLGWSVDHGQTWTWGPTFTTLGYPTFVNFGKDYAGARDGYVYTVSHDDPNAYTPSDHFILLRVPIASITNMGAYEYFVGIGGGGAPVWSFDPGQRGAVFTHVNAGEGRCARSGISYHAPSGRYLWWQQYPKDGGDTHTTFSGGFGVYDAPEPWGPWTTVYFTPEWDQGPGDCGGFCTKYTSGNTVWLVFSGNDNLRLRRATLTTTPVAAPSLAASTALPIAVFPNPFTSGMRTEFRLAGPRAVRIDVRDLHGRPVVALLDRALEGGAHSVAWNGRDESGRPVAAGVYFVRLDLGGEVQSRRIVHLR